MTHFSNIGHWKVPIYFPVTKLPTKTGLKCIVRFFNTFYPKIKYEY